MRKLISLLFFVPLISFSQALIDVGFDDKDSLRKVIITPFLSTHISSYNLDKDANTFLAYGATVYRRFSSKFEITSKILKARKTLNKYY